MQHDRNSYLTPLLEKGPLPLGQLIFLATGEIYQGGSGMQDILDDLEELCRTGAIRVEYHHSPRRRRIERTYHLTVAGRRACEAEQKEKYPGRLLGKTHPNRRPVKKTK